MSFFDSGRIEQPARRGDPFEEVRIAQATQGYEIHRPPEHLLELLLETEEGIGETHTGRRFELDQEVEIAGRRIEAAATR
jgi:hypothetical protein